MSDTPADQFDAFVRDHGERLRRALVAAYGLADGADATQSALSYGWEYWERVSAMSNPAGYLYRVGQTAARRARSSTSPLLHDPGGEGRDAPDLEPGLMTALIGLTEAQRIAVLLVHGHGYRLAEVADVLNVGVSTVRNHLSRGLDKLRRDLGVNHASV